MYSNSAAKPPPTAAHHNMGHLLYHPLVTLPPRALIKPRLRSAVGRVVAVPISTLKRQYSPSSPTREAVKLIDKISTSTDGGKAGFSFEFFTPKQRHNYSPSLTEAFMTNVARMTSHGPNFCGMMWRHTDPYPPLTLDLAARIQNHLNIDTLLHLTCVNMPLHHLDHALNTARSSGIRNILAIRGDTPSPHTPPNNELSSSLDLVRHIRAKHLDYFCIAVAGYPEGHHSKVPEGRMGVTAEGYESELRYLKSKVDAGAELIITQLFLDAEVFLKFVRDCRRIGILCPVVPGVLPITAYRNFKLMTDTCRIGVPDEVRKAVEAVRGDDAALAAYGVDQATGMCKRILDSGVRQLHFYTMNKEGPTVAVLRNLGLVGGV